MTAEEEAEAEAPQEDCPVCCEPLSPADRQYPLHCTTASCHYQFCLSCLEHLARSAAEGYTQASDGSNQVKVALQCPQCRGEYCNRKDDSNPFVAAASIVNAVLQLRRAASTPLPGGAVPDSTLSATQLSHRRRFLEEVGHVKVLRDSYRLVQRYHDSLRPDKQCGTLPELDWEAWRPHLQEAAQHAPCAVTVPSSDSNDSSCCGGESSAALVLPRDPTLFLGLEDLMTTDEQEFITSMLVSGHAELLAQAANLLQNITQVSVGQRSAAAVQQMAFSSSSSANTNTTNSNRTNLHQPSRPSKAQLEHQQRVRNRFPLPGNMPRSVNLPIYDPVYDKKPPLEFVGMQVPKQQQSNSNNSKELPPPPPELALAAVRGPAGRAALRKGDCVTHVNGEPVTTVGEFVVALQLAQDRAAVGGGDDDHGSTATAAATFQLTVNANDATALALRSRAQEMKLQKVRFH